MMTRVFQENHETRQHGNTCGGLAKPVGNNKRSRNPGMLSWNAWQPVGNKHPGGGEKAAMRTEKSPEKVKAAANRFSGGPHCRAFWNKNRFGSH